jgi:YVTN family beta-propeller protein
VPQLPPAVHIRAQGRTSPPRTTLSKGSSARRFIAVAIVCALVAGGAIFGHQVQHSLDHGSTLHALFSSAVRPFTTSVGVGTAPSALAYDSGKGEVFVTNYGSNNVSVINATTDHVVTNIPVGSTPDAVAYDAATGMVFVSNWGTANVSVINDTSNLVVKNIPVGGSPDGVTYDSAKGEIFVADKLTNNLSVINDTSDTVTLSIAMPVGPSLAPDYPYALVYDGAKGEIFVAASEPLSPPYQYELALVYNDTNNSLAANVNIGNYSDGTLSVAYDFGRGQVFFTNAYSGLDNEYSGTTTVISDSSNTVVAKVGVDLDDPDAVGYDSGLGEVFVGNYGQHDIQSNVSVVNDSTDTITATIPVGIQPDGITYDPVNGDVLVADYGGGNVTVISPAATPPTYAITFTESGLSSGTDWSVTLNGSQEGSSLTTIVFSQPVGSYNYTVGSVVGYTSNPLSGQVVVSGAAVRESVTFTAVVPGTYPLSVTETGLPGGTNWSVTIGSTTQSSTGTQVVFQEPNGSYDYQVGSVSGYNVSPSRGEVNVTGEAKNVDVTFSSTVGSPPPPSTSASGLSTLDYGIIAAVILLVAILALLFFWMSRRKKDAAPPPTSVGTPVPENPPPPP